jgi:hypothetical protein
MGVWAGPCASASASSPRPDGEDALRRDLLLPGGRAAHLEARVIGGSDAVGACVCAAGDPVERDLCGRGR